MPAFRGRDSEGAVGLPYSRLLYGPCAPSLPPKEAEAPKFTPVVPATTRTPTSLSGGAWSSGAWASAHTAAWISLSSLKSFLWVAPLFLGRLAVLVEQRRGLSGRRNLPHPAVDFPLPVADLVFEIAGLLCPPVGQYRQVAVFTDHQVPREAAVEFPAGVCKSLLYLFPDHASNSFIMEKRRTNSEPRSSGENGLKCAEGCTERCTERGRIPWMYNLDILARVVEGGYRGMHCASLRVIILEPEASRPDKSEGGAIVSRVRYARTAGNSPSTSGAGETPVPGKAIMLVAC